jgi:hypothetical protein
MIQNYVMRAKNTTVCNHPKTRFKIAARCFEKKVFFGGGGEGAIASGARGRKLPGLL